MQAERHTMPGRARPRLEVRPLHPQEAALVVDYFLGLPDADMERMGIVERSRLPGRDAWVARLQAALAVPPAESGAAYVAWLADGRPVGFASLKGLRPGESGEMHLHMWDAGLRGQGLGAELFCRSALQFHDRFGPLRIVCEPRAANPMPNRLLHKAGFKLLGTREGASSELSRVTTLNTYLVERDAAAACLERVLGRRPGVHAEPAGLPPAAALRPTLRGRHVTLEPLEERHAGDLWPAADEPGLWDHMTFDVRSPDDLGDWVRARVAAREAGTAAPLLVRLADGTAVGSTSIFDVTAHRTMEVGHTWLGAAARRTAANTEAKRLVLAHCFEALGAVRVQLKCDERNQRSARAIERIGATYEGTLRSQMVLAGGHRRDVRLYSILDSEWPAVRARLDAVLAR